MQVDRHPSFGPARQFVSYQVKWCDVMNGEHGKRIGRLTITLLYLAFWTFVVSAEDSISFSRHVQPIFAEHCLQCHGPDEENRAADLRLDVESSAKESAINTDNPKESELLARVTSRDPDSRMPPAPGSRLSEQQVSLLRRWIAAGAKYQRHWAYQPILDVDSPSIADSDERKLSDIDRFVIAKLRENDLELSQPATKQQLIRRATFDLTGLPPKWTDVSAFIEDTSADAFAKVVDRLLNSKAYGEHWSRHWLDIARYADTHGGAAIGFKEFPFSYTYRDYVIQAFNADLPYNRFITEQLAADQLGLTDNAEQLAALGFLTVGMQFRNPHNVIDDRIDVVSRGLLGLTVSCARCHDHKFDAISTRDYYSLYATLASSDKPEELPRIGESKPSADLDEYEERLRELKTSYSDMAREQSEIMRGRLRMQVGLYLREIAKGAAEPDLVSADVFSYRTDDLRPLVLHRWQTYMRQMSEQDAVFGPWVKLTKRSVGDAAQFALSSEQLVEKLKNENGSAKDMHKLSAKAPKWNPRVLEVLTKKKPQSMLDVADAYGELFAEVQREWLAGLLKTSLEAEPGLAPVPDEHVDHLAVNSPVNRELRRHLYGPNSPIEIEDRRASRLLNRPINDNVSGRRGAIHSLNLHSAGSPPRAMVLTEKINMPPFRVFLRGNPRQPGQRVAARFLTVLGGTDRQSYLPGKRRLELARSIVDPVNPLTRRVVVNWVWQHHFGQGLVRTPDDFGTRGNPPTHPQLLDYLATKFHEDGWSLKKLHRRVLLSHVYQQAAVERRHARIVDPQNNLLWRMPRKRLRFEAMRDAMLCASGELKETLGGRPFRLLSDPIVPHRSVYAFVNRDIVAPVRSTFDTANPNACTAKRPTTTIPQQALFVLNSDFIQDRAAAMVKMVSQKVTTDAQLVQVLYRRAFARNPNNQELDTAVAFVASQRTGQDDLVGWKRLAHALLAANEFVFLD